MEQVRDINKPQANKVETSDYSTTWCIMTKHTNITEWYLDKNNTLGICDIKMLIFPT